VLVVEPVKRSRWGHLDVVIRAPVVRTVAAMAYLGSARSREDFGLVDHLDQVPARHRRCPPAIDLVGVEPAQKPEL
jgi:hypothetical protein